jgi:hypothetical protein
VPTFSVCGHKLKHFDLKAKSLMENHLGELDINISDYTFAANYIWLSNASGFYAIIHDSFCLFAMTGSELSMLLPPLGKKENFYDAIMECFKIMNTNNASRYYSKIDYVAEKMLENFVNDLEEGTIIYEVLQDFIVERKLVDYLYKSDDLIELKGNAYHTKRNEINKFKKAYPNFRVQILDPEIHAKPIMLLFHKWVSDRIKYMPKEEAELFLEGIYQEQHAVKRMLAHFNELGLIGIVLYIDEEVKGFTVGERINDETASVIIEKTDFEILGCAQFVFREFSKILKDTYGSLYINVGDDMGFENLKKVKMSYRPDKLIPKYTIYQK